MKEKALSHLRFQTFFASKETCNSQLADEIIGFTQYLDDKKIINEESSGSISIGTSSRILINGEGVNLTRLTKEGIVEVVDYDPVKNIILAVGRIEPCTQTPVHWMIHRARCDVHAAAMIRSEKLMGYFENKDVPVTQREYPPGSFELVKEVLKTLKTSRIIRVINNGVLIVGISLKEIESVLDNIV
jgi:hypothetical protein